MEHTKTKKLIIIGSGPAGLSASVYAARANLKPLIIDGPTPGGQLTLTSDIENWIGEKKISGPKLIGNMREHAKHFGCEFLSESVAEINVENKPFIITTSGNKKLKAESIIIATGARPRKLGVPGEQDYWGKGISACAVCDGAFFKDKEVVVVGGGDSAMENASFLSNFTDKITVIHILDKLTASTSMQKRVLKNPNIKIIYNSTIAEILGNGDKITELIVENQKTNEKRNLKADGLFISIGLVPNTEFLKKKIDLDDWGYIKIWHHQKLGHTSTSVRGIFAAGDVFDYMYKQAITAAGMGCMAALDAERYLNNNL